MLVRSLVFSMAIPVALLAQGFEYAPGSAQYRITRVEKLTQDMMGQKQSGENTVSQMVTITLNRISKDTLGGLLVLDSASFSSTFGPAPSLTHLLGQKVQTRISPNGAVVYSVEGPKEEDVPMASQLTTGMSAFLPKIRGRVAKGATWADTATGTVKQFGIDLTRRVVSTYVVVGDTTVAGESGWMIAKKDSTTLGGTGIGQAGSMSVEGNSATSGQFVITSKGAFLGGDASEEGSVRILISANNAEIGITTSSTMKVLRVK